MVRHMIEINLGKDLQEIINQDKEIKESIKSIQEKIENRDEHLKEIIRSLNNHRELLKKEYGLSSFNYADICYEHADSIKNSRYMIKTVFTSNATGKELGVIEEITGCTFKDFVSHNFGEYIYYFSLPEIVKYDERIIK